MKTAIKAYEPIRKFTALQVETVKINVAGPSTLKTSHKNNSIVVTLVWVMDLKTR